MQIAGPQTTATATSTPVQPLASPNNTASQAGNIVMVIDCQKMSLALA